MTDKSDELLCSLMDTVDQIALEGGLSYREVITALLGLFGWGLCIAPHDREEKEELRRWAVTSLLNLPIPGTEEGGRGKGD